MVNREEVGMTERKDLDAIRVSALERINRSERNFKLAFFAAGVLEFVFIVSFLLLADLSNRTHVLLLIATVSSYSIIVLGLVALGSHINRSVLRVITAVETLKN
jgi:hypothetical protein